MFKKLTFITILLLPILANAAGIKQFQLDKPFEVTDVQFVDENNIIHNLTDYKGKVVLLNFWATWCGPCVSEMASLSRLADNVKGQDIEIIPVSIEYKDIEVIRKFYKEHNITNIPAYRDDRGNSFKALKLQALPTSFVVNKEGKAVAKILGEIDWADKEAQGYLEQLGR